MRQEDSPVKGHHLASYPVDRQLNPTGNTVSQYGVWALELSCPRGQGEAVSGCFRAFTHVLCDH